MVQKFILGVLFTAISLSAYAGGTLADISLAIQAGNAKELVKYFDASVGITINESEKVYSKNQSLQVINNFFTKNQPNSFSIIHQGSSGQGEYAIGTLVTSGGTYRTYLYMKDKGGSTLLQEIRFELD